MKGTEDTNNNSHSDVQRRSKKATLENSPDKEKFDKCIEELNQILRKRKHNEMSL